MVGVMHDGQTNAAESETHDNNHQHQKEGRGDHSRNDQGVRSKIQKKHDHRFDDHFNVGFPADLVAGEVSVYPVVERCNKIGLAA